MLKDRAAPHAYILFAAIFNVAIAYLFGNDGYEAFVTLALSLGLLITWQIIGLIKSIFRSKIWLIIKLTGFALLGFFWFVTMTAIILSLSKDVHNPKVSTPPVSWPVVIIGTLPFLLPRLYARKKNADSGSQVIAAVSSFYSIMILFIATIGFYDDGERYRRLMLVLAIQLQYLMNHVVINTDYLNRAQVTAANFAQRFNTSRDSRENLMILLVGLPFILPLTVVLLISFF